jgi:hypothetical protein
MTKDDLLEHFDEIVTDPRLRRDLVEAHLIDLRASEAGGIAGTCPQGLGLHLNDDLVLVEPVDTHGRPTPVGELSAKVYDNGSWPTR